MKKLIVVSTTRDNRNANNELLKGARFITNRSVRIAVDNTVIDKVKINDWLAKNNHVVVDADLDKEEFLELFIKSLHTFKFLDVLRGFDTTTVYAYGKDSNKAIQAIGLLRKITL
jgi:hypothetical protein